MERIIMSFVSRRMRHTALAGLDDEQRERINRCLCDGEPADDPTLAEPLVRQADRMLDMAFEIPVKLMVLVVVMATLSSVGMLLLGRPKGTGFPWFPVAMIAAALWLLYAVPKLNRFWRHVIRSRKATKDRWGIRS